MAEREFRTEDGRTRFTLEVDGSVYGGRPINYKGETYKVQWPPVPVREAAQRDARPVAYRVRLFDQPD